MNSNESPVSKEDACRVEASCTSVISNNVQKAYVNLSVDGNNSLCYAGSSLDLSETNTDVVITPSGGSMTDSSIFGLAKAFLLLESMTHKKLQKLCYYAKAWYLALYDANLIDEDFQAWVHGAVQPGLYQQYKKYGFSPIPQIVGRVLVPEEFLSFSKEVFAAYGHLSGDELEALNHSEDPWIEARGSLRPWEKCNEVISEVSMKSFYRKMIRS